MVSSIIQLTMLVIQSLIERRLIIMTAVDGLCMGAGEFMALGN
jgi:hypothetical protein